MTGHDYPNTRRVVYGDERATFVPVCPHCGRYVKPDELIYVNDTGLSPKPNATCRKCGRVQMVFEGFM